MQLDPTHLTAGGTSVVLVQDVPGLPRIAYWGADLGPLPVGALEALARATLPQRVSGGLDRTAVPSILPLESDGWQYTPALAGSDADGTRVGLAFVLSHVDTAPDTLALVAEDEQNGLAVEVEIRLDGAGLLHQRIAVVNRGSTPWRVDRCAATFVLPSAALELLDTTGRHLKERTPQRQPFTIGEHRRESRRGRPGADATLLLTAGEQGFGWRSGVCHGVTVAWSGNHLVEALRTPTSAATLTGGELLLPGEVLLAPEERYTAPDVVGAWGTGLDEIAARFHRSLRARPGHPRTPRPVTLNTWEAVYFDHELERLTDLADVAARVGVERFVLDDGWFTGRRDDTTALGDWQVDPQIWPDGLHALVRAVHDRGMQFGLWVEPEMVSPSSDLARAHPEWILGPQHRDPLSGRQQQVLNLADPGAFAFILEALDELLRDYPIDYLKWDHNRDLIEGIDRASGRYAVHAVTEAVYALMDELRARHPGLEIESCASGGARVDLGILERTDRIWVSDCIDPIERLDNQAFTNLVVPYELMGAHLGAQTSHSTFRTTSLTLQAGVALFGHFGIERDLTRATGDDVEQIAAWVALHKQLRPLLHTGTSVHADPVDPALDVRGVVAEDRSHAVYSLVQRAATVGLPPGRITLPGLDPDRLYRVEILTPHSLDAPGQSPLAWAAAPTDLPGRVLTEWGLQAPVLFPESAVVLHVTAQEDAG